MTDLVPLESARPALSPKTVLVVDDEDAIVELVVASLRRSSYRLLTAADGEEALCVAREQRPDLILLDVAMPGIDGFEVCRRLKGDPATRDALVLMLTARTQPDDVARGKAVGADGYLAKPFRPSHLQQRVGETLAQT